MTGRTEGLTKTYKAGAAINPHRIVKLSADDTVVQGAAATDLLIGVADSLGADSGGRVDVVMSGIATIKAGGNITRGNLVTSDASGQAVAAAPSTGVNNYSIGIALVTAASGDEIPVLIAPSRPQG